MAGRALSFGASAAAYERFRPGYPAELLDLVMAYAGSPIRTALEVGAGTGKATRLFAAHGVAVTATDPDPAMLAELRDRVPAGVTTLQAALEDLRPGDKYDLVLVAAALHWTDPAGRWPRIAAFLRRGGVFTAFGAPLHLSDPALDQAVREARTPFLTTDDIPAPAEQAEEWPGTELRRSGWFTDVRRSVIERRLTMTAPDYIGHLSTISAYIALPPPVREEAFRSITAVLPDTIELTADVTVHLARRGGDR